MGWVIAAILAGMLAEGALLFAYHARTGRGPAPRLLLPNLAAGAMLLLAALCVIEGVGWAAAAASMFAALVAHIADVRARWRN